MPSFLLFIFVLFTSVIQASSLDEHFIFIDNKGRLNNASENRIVQYKPYVDNILQNLKLALEKDKDFSLTLYIHGGLNSFENARNRSKSIYPKMLKDKQYPIFISWEAAPLNNYIDHLLYLRNGERSTEKGLPSSVFIFSEDMLRSFARSPTSSWNTFFGQNNFSILKKDKKFATLSQAQIRTKKEFNIHCSAHNSSDKFSDYLTFLNPVKLMTAPMIDGFGKGTWDSLLRRTDLILNGQSAYKGFEEKRSQTAVYYLLEQIKQTYPDLKVNLIAHSMGTIIADNFLSRFPTINYKNIIYMASASSLKDIKKSIVPWLKKDTSKHFYNLSLHPYNDMTENEYYDFIPRGSILIWIDEFLEDVNSFEDRRAGFWYNMMRSAEIIFPKEVRQQVHFSCFGRNNNTPQIHKDFAKFPFWKEKFWTNTF